MTLVARRQGLEHTPGSTVRDTDCMLGRLSYGLRCIMNLNGEAPSFLWGTKDTCDSNTVRDTMLIIACAMSEQFKLRDRAFAIMVPDGDPKLKGMSNTFYTYRLDEMRARGIEVNGQAIAAVGHRSATAQIMIHSRTWYEKYIVEPVKFFAANGPRMRCSTCSARSHATDADTARTALTLALLAAAARS